MRKLIRKHWLLSILVVLVIFFTGSWGALAYTNNPAFCTKCHVMDPYCNTWASSTHSKVACVDCHYAPGDKYKIWVKAKSLNQVAAYWTGHYDTKFYADIKDASCMVCHKLEDLNKPVKYNGHVNFDHSKHYGKDDRGIKLLCTSCHSHSEKDQHFSINKNACYLCHFRGEMSASVPKKQEFCTKCHDVPEKDIEISGQTYSHASYVEQGVDCQRCHIDAVEGQGDVETRSCEVCHDDPKLPDTAAEREELHRTHVTEHKVDCFRCHTDITHGVRPTGKQIVFSCNQCHSQPHLGPQELYAGKGGRGVDEMPSAMYKAQVDCVGCHLEDHTFGAESTMKGAVMRPSVKACVDCHGDLGSEMYNMWTQMLADSIAAATKAVAAAQSKVDTAAEGTPGLAEARKLLEDAQYNLDFVRFGKGIHNVGYSTALLDKSIEFANQALEKLGAAPAAE
ncbi:NapC/NirT family cytochrome c [bacterium]|nr:NapC/NirT family cytochrome c [bacterium]